MKIQFIHQFFKTPKEPGSTRSYWLSQALIKKGFNVTMFTSDTTGSQKKLLRRVVIDKINVIYIKNFYSNDMGIIARFISFLKFMIFSTFFALKEKRIDLVFSTSTPLTIGFPALKLRWIKRKKFIFEVRDLWPEVPIQMGGLNNKLLQKNAIWLERTIYRKAEQIIALSPGIRQGVLKHGIAEEKVAMVPNMAKINKFFPRVANIKIANKFGINNKKFKLIHFGAMGIASGLEYIIEATKILKRPSVKKMKLLTYMYKFPFLYYIYSKINL